MITESKLILSALINNDDYFTKVFPHLKAEYFDNSEKIIFEVISDFVKSYQAIPSKEAVQIETSKKKIRQNLYQDTLEVIEDIFKYDITDKDLEWLIKTSEKYCKDVSIRLGLIKSNEILEGSSKTNLSETAIPDILLEAVSISFEQNIGHDYLGGAEERYDYYTIEEKKVKTDIEVINEITCGGFSKPLNLFISPQHGGKSLNMCSLCASNLLLGYHVLYVTLEESDLDISRRIDANILDLDIKKLSGGLNKDEYLKIVNSVKSKTLGRLNIFDSKGDKINIFKLKSLIEDLKTKKGFIPDIVYIDYLTLMTSIDYQKGKVNDYAYYKGVSEEVRNLSKRLNIPFVSALQFNRSGSKNPDADLTDIAESYGIAMTADLGISISQNEELIKINQYRYKQLKNRYDDLQKIPEFYLGVDKSHMRVYEIDTKYSNNNYEEEFKSFESTMTDEDILSKLRSFSSF